MPNQLPFCKKFINFFFIKDLFISQIVYTIYTTKLLRNTSTTLYFINYNTKSFLKHISAINLLKQQFINFNL